jgi:hypothetical protein
MWFFKGIARRRYADRYAIKTFGMSWRFEPREW